MINTETNTVVATVSAGTSPVAIGNFIGGSPAAAAVSVPMPTLSEWAMITLATLLALLTSRIHRNRRMTLFWSDFANA